METAARSPERPAPQLLEMGSRLSESMLWEYQRQFYSRMGIRAWREGHVPYYITTNPFIARTYARAVAGRARDLLADLEPGACLEVIELGSGPGRFAFHFLRSILPVWRSSVFRGIRLRYVMTDLSESNLDFWRKHPRLATFVDAGALDFALFDPTAEDSLRLGHAGESLTPAGVVNPVAFLAKYFAPLQRLGCPRPRQSIAGGDPSRRFSRWTSAAVLDPRGRAGLGDLL